MAQVIKIPAISVQMWVRADGSWCYDGPTGCGPKDVRASGRGPYWTGTVEEKHVKDLVRRAKRKGLEVREE